eukprot:CAMPEP_0204455996 /NCGR_PEP_ID=MMETSP0471-20130131/1783_1 /ASSEMBLY_ACC=CAM_ASM_000602 /TAXON_ID=2969 /ORGANISM="Oxyrrhis marina" /LENGTH=4932 /DNA_ID=CAMNT_0051456183 /DNA_START=1 /DNA_END=14799 /DNA_ORIENTATION=-
MLRRGLIVASFVSAAAANLAAPAISVSAPEYSTVANVAPYSNALPQSDFAIALRFGETIQAGTGDIQFQTGGAEVAGASISCAGVKIAGSYASVLVKNSLTAGAVHTMTVPTTCFQNTAETPVGLATAFTSPQLTVGTGTTADVIGPVLWRTFSNPSHGASLAQSISVVELVFSEVIVKGRGFVRVMRTQAGGTPVEHEAVDVASAVIADNQATFTLTVPLVAGSAYAIGVDGGAFRDVAGNSNEQVERKVQTVSALTKSTATGASATTRIQVVNHGLQTGDVVQISGVTASSWSTRTSFQNTDFVVTTVDADTITVLYDSFAVSSPGSSGFGSLVRDRTLTVTLPSSLAVGLETSTVQYPAHEAIDVPVAGTVALNFEHPVAAGVGSAVMQLCTAKTASDPCSASVSVSATQCSFVGTSVLCKPSALVQKTEYRVQVPSDGIMNAELLLPSDGTASFSFRTLASTQATITAITKASPAEVTVTGHGFVSGSRVTISGVGDDAFGSLVNGVHSVTLVSANTFTLDGVDTQDNSKSFTLKRQGNPTALTVTGLNAKTGQKVTIANVVGWTALNGVHEVTAIDATTYSVLIDSSALDAATLDVTSATIALGGTPTYTGARAVASDETAPLLVQTTFSDVPVAASTNFQLGWSEAATLVVGKQLTVTSDFAGDAAVTVSPTASANSYLWTIPAPSGGYKTGRTFTVTVPAGMARDSASNLAAASSFTFATLAVVTGHYPAAGSMAVDPATILRVSFQHEPTVIASDQLGLALSVSGVSQLVSSSDSDKFYVEGSDLIIMLNEALQTGATVSATLHAGSVQHLTADVAWSFSTAQRAAAMLSVLVTVPADDAAVTALNTPVSFVFSEAVEVCPQTQEVISVCEVDAAGACVASGYSVSISPQTVCDDIATVTTGCVIRGLSQGSDDSVVQVLPAGHATRGNPSNWAVAAKSFQVTIPSNAFCVPGSFGNSTVSAQVKLNVLAAAAPTPAPVAATEQDTTGPHFLTHAAPSMVQSDLTVLFSEAVVVTASNIQMLGEAAALTCGSSPSSSLYCRAAGQRLLISRSGGWDSTKTYSLSVPVSAVADRRGNALTAAISGTIMGVTNSVVFSFADPVAAAVTATFSPAAASSSAREHDAIVITFSEAVTAEASAQFTIFSDSACTTAVHTTLLSKLHTTTILDGSVSKTRMVFHPPSPLTPGEQYWADFSAGGVHDSVGVVSSRTAGSTPTNTQCGSTVGFQVSLVKDSVVPILQGWSVGAGGIVPASGVVATLIFSETVISVTAKQVSVVPVGTASGTAVTVGAVSGNTVEVTIPALIAGGSYTLSIEAGAFTDAASNELAAVSGPAFSVALPSTDNVKPRVVDSSLPGLVGAFSPGTGASRYSNSRFTITFNELASGVAGKYVTMYSDSACTSAQQRFDAGSLETTVVVRDSRQVTVALVPIFSYTSSLWVDVQDGAFVNRFGVETQRTVGSGAVAGTNTMCGQTQGALQVITTKATLPTLVGWSVPPGGPVHAGYKASMAPTSAATSSLTIIGAPFVDGSHVLFTGTIGQVTIASGAIDETGIVTTASAHGFTSTNIVTAVGTSNGLTSGTTYYVKVLTATTLSLHTAAARSDADLVKYTASPAGSLLSNAISSGSLFYTKTATADSSVSLHTEVPMTDSNAVVVPAGSFGTLAHLPSVSSVTLFFDDTVQASTTSGLTFQPSTGDALCNANDDYDTGDDDCGFSAPQVSITAISVAAEAVVTTSSPHNYHSGDSVTISGVTATVAEATVASVAANVVTTAAAHGFGTGTAVVLVADQVPSGFSTSTTYYIAATSSTTLTLHSSAADATAGSNAVTADTLVAGNKFQQTATTWATVLNKVHTSIVVLSATTFRLTGTASVTTPLGVVGLGTASVVATQQVPSDLATATYLTSSLADSVVTTTDSSPDLPTGTMVEFAGSSTGLTSGSTYFIRRTATRKFELYDTRANAESGSSGKVTIAALGSATFKVTGLRASGASVSVALPSFSAGVGMKLHMAAGTFQDTRTGTPNSNLPFDGTFGHYVAPTAVSKTADHGATVESLAAMTLSSAAGGTTQVTLDAHGFVAGDVVVMTGVGGWTAAAAINGKMLCVGTVTTNQFSLDIDSSTETVAVTITAPTVKKQTAVSASNHALIDGTTVIIAGVTGTGWDGLNGNHVAKVCGSSQFSVALDTSAATGTADLTSAIVRPAVATAGQVFSTYVGAKPAYSAPTYYDAFTFTVTSGTGSAQRSSVMPANAATVVNPTAVVEVLFTEPVTAGAGKVTCGSREIDVTDTSQVHFSGTRMYIFPGVYESGAVSISIPEGAVTDTSNPANMLDTSSLTGSWYSFTTADSDQTLPTSTVSFPQGVAHLSTNVMLAFSEEITRGTGSVLLTPAATQSVTVLAVSSTTRIISVRADHSFSTGTAVTFTGTGTGITSGSTYYATWLSTRTFTLHTAAPPTAANLLSVSSITTGGTFALAAVALDIADTSVAAVAGSTAVLMPRGVLSGSATYAITIPSTAFADAAGNKMADVFGRAAFVTAVHNAPGGVSSPGPQLIAMTPANSASVGPTSGITMLFSSTVMPTQFLSFPVGAISRTSNTATVTVTGHSFVVGDLVTLSGVAGFTAAYLTVLHSEHQVTAVTTNTFSIVAAASETTTTGVFTNARAYKGAITIRESTGAVQVVAVDNSEGPGTKVYYQGPLVSVQTAVPHSEGATLTVDVGSGAFVDVHGNAAVGITQLSLTVLTATLAKLTTTGTVFTPRHDAGSVTFAGSTFLLGGDSEYSKPVSGLTRGTYPTITSANHGLSSGSSITVSGVTGPAKVTTAINNDHVVRVVDDNTLAVASKVSLSGVQVVASLAMGATVMQQSAAVVVSAATVASPVALTASGHGFSKGETVVVGGVTGGTWGTLLNGEHEIYDVVGDSIHLVGVDATAAEHGVVDLTGATVVAIARGVVVNMVVASATPVDYPEEEVLRRTGLTCARISAGKYCAEPEGALCATTCGICPGSTAESSPCPVQTATVHVIVETGVFKLGSGLRIGATAVTGPTAVEVMSGKTTVPTTVGEVAVTDVTAANPAVVTTASAHGFTTGDSVTIAGVSARSGVVATHTITVESDTMFRLDGVDTSGDTGDATYTDAKAIEASTAFTSAQFSTGPMMLQDVVMSSDGAAWSHAGFLPTPRAGANCFAATSERIFVLGGSSGGSLLEGDQMFLSSADGASFTPVQLLSAVTIDGTQQFPRPIDGHSMAAQGWRLVVVGGGTGFMFMSHNPEATVWEAPIAAPFDSASIPRHMPLVAARSDESVVVVGGQSPDGAQFRDVWLWTEDAGFRLIAADAVGSATKPFALTGAFTLMHDDTMLVLGGYPEDASGSKAISAVVASGTSTRFTAASHGFAVGNVVVLGGVTAANGATATLTRMHGHLVSTATTNTFDLAFDQMRTGVAVYASHVAGQTGVLTMSGAHSFTDTSVVRFDGVSTALQAGTDYYVKTVAGQPTQLTLFSATTRLDAEKILFETTESITSGKLAVEATLASQRIVELGTSPTASKVMTTILQSQQSFDQTAPTVVFSTSGSISPSGPIEVLFSEPVSVMNLKVTIDAVNSTFVSDLEGDTKLSVTGTGAGFGFGKTVVVSGRAVDHSHGMNFASFSVTVTTAAQTSLSPTVTVAANGAVLDSTAHAALITFARDVQPVAGKMVLGVEATTCTPVSCTSGSGMPGALCTAPAMAQQWVCPTTTATAVSASSVQLTVDAGAFVDGNGVESAAYDSAATYTSVVADARPPTPVAYWPADGATGTAPDTYKIRIVFDEPVQAGAGAVSIKKQGATAAVPVSPAQVSVSGSVVTVDLLKQQSLTLPTPTAAKTYILADGSAVTGTPATATAASLAAALRQDGNYNNLPYSVVAVDGGLEITYAMAGDVTTLARLQPTGGAVVTAVAVEGQPTVTQRINVTVVAGTAYTLDSGAILKTAALGATPDAAVLVAAITGSAASTTLGTVAYASMPFTVSLIGGEAVLTFKTGWAGYSMRPETLASLQEDGATAVAATRMLPLQQTDVCSAAAAGNVEISMAADAFKDVAATPNSVVADPATPPYVFAIVNRDCTGPTITVSAATVVPSGESAASPRPTLQFTFNEAVQVDTNAAVHIVGGQSPVAVSLTGAVVSGTNVMLPVRDALPAGGSFSIVVPQFAVHDLAGNPFGGLEAGLATFSTFSMLSFVDAPTQPAATLLPRTGAAMVAHGSTLLIVGGQTVSGSAGSDDVWSAATGRPSHCAAGDHPPTACTTDSCSGNGTITKEKRIYRVATAGGLPCKGPAAEPGANDPLCLIGGTYSPVTQQFSLQDHDCTRPARAVGAVVESETEPCECPVCHTAAAVDSTFPRALADQQFGESPFSTRDLLCEEGYTGSAQLRCTGHPRWSMLGFFHDPLPSCRANPCTAEPVVAYAIGLSCAANVSHPLCPGDASACISGNPLVGEGDRRCTFQCAPGTTITAQEGRAAGDGHFCEKGDFQVGELCQRKPCGQLVLPNATAQCSMGDGLLDDECQVECQPGFKLKDSADWRNCSVIDATNADSDVEWTGAECVPQECSNSISALDANLASDATCDTNEFGAQDCVVNCKEGFGAGGTAPAPLPGQASFECSLKDDCTGADCVEFTQTAVCAELSCDTLVIANTKTQCTNTALGDICEVECADGYDLTGTSSVTCEATATALQWSAVPTCTESPCSALISGIVGECANPVDHDQSCKLECEAGLQLAGLAEIPVSLVCQLGVLVNASELSCVTPGATTEKVDVIAGSMAVAFGSAADVDAIMDDPDKKAAFTSSLQSAISDTLGVDASTVEITLAKAARRLRSFKARRLQAAGIDVSYTVEIPATFDDTAKQELLTKATEAATSTDALQTSLNAKLQEANLPASTGVDAEPPALATITREVSGSATKSGTRMAHILAATVITALVSQLL